MSPRTFAMLLAGAFLAVGLFGLLSTISTADTEDCGTAIAPRPGAGRECVAARDDRNLWALPATGLGVAGLLGAAFVRRRQAPAHQALVDLKAGDEFQFQGRTWRVLGTVNELDGRAFIENRGQDDIAAREKVSGEKRIFTREFLSTRNVKIIRSR